MNTFWKWILGIVIVLLVLFGLGIGSRLLMANFLPTSAVSFDGFRHPMMFDGRGFDGFDGYGGMMHHGGFMSLGWLLPLVLIGLVVYGAYRLGSRKSANNQAPLPLAAPAVVRTCTKCGQQVQEGWMHCANCGKKL